MNKLEGAKAFTTELAITGGFMFTDWLTTATVIRNGHQEINSLVPIFSPQSVIENFGLGGYALEKTIAFIAACAILIWASKTESGLRASVWMMRGINTVTAGACVNNIILGSLPR